MINMNNIQENDDRFYPEIYRHFAPVADQLIRDMEKNHGDIFLNEDLLQQMIDEAIRRAEADAPASAEAEEELEDAIPTIYSFGGGRGRGRGGRRGGGWRGYGRGALDDIFRILLLQQIIGGRRSNWRWR